MQTADIAKLLETQEEKASQLLEILAHELEILKNREIPALEAKAQEKEQCLSQIDQIDKTIKQQISLEELQANATYAEQVDRITALFAQCKEQNEINGQIINNSQIAINRFKGMLQKSISNNTLTYDQKGNTNIKAKSFGLKA